MRSVPSEGASNTAISIEPQTALSRRLLAYEARDQRTPLSIGVLGNAADVLPDLLRRSAEIDIVTDQTSAHDPLSYLPVGLAFEDWATPVATTRRD